MINKIVDSYAAAVADIRDGAVVAVGGFGEVGMPTELLHALIEQGAKDLTVIANNAGVGHTGLAALMEAGRVRKIICSFPRSAGSVVFEQLYAAGKLELELVPQGTLAERLRAAGAGIAAFYTPTGVGTKLAHGKEVREIDGKEYVLERALAADVALIRVWRADRWGNATFNLSGRNFAHPMAMAARQTIAMAHGIAELGTLDPDHVHLPGIFVHRVVALDAPDRRSQYP